MPIEELTFRDVSDVKLPDEITDIFKASGVRVRRANGQNVMIQSDETRDVFLIESGTVEVSIQAANGKEYIFREVGRGSLIGEMSAIDGERRSATVTAVGEAVLYKIPSSRFLTMILDNPIFSKLMMISLVKRIRNTSEQLFELASMNVRSRILLDVIRRAYQSGVIEDRAHFLAPRDQSKAATALATHREAISREYSALIKEGLITRKGESFIVPSVSTLEATLERMIGQ